MPDTSDPDRLDLEELRHFVGRRWPLVAGMAGGCALLALAVCLALRPTYTATSQVLLDPHRQHVFGVEAVQPDAALDSAIVDSQISILTSTRLLAKVVTKENLAADPEFAGTGKVGLLARLLALVRPVAVRSAEPLPLDGIDPKLAPAILNLFSRVEVTRIAKSYVLSLSVSSRDAAKATRLANGLAAAFTEDRVNVQARALGQAAAFFEDRLGTLRDQVRVSERAVTDFRKAHDLTAATLDGRTTVGELQLQHLNEQLALAATDTAEKLARYRQAAQFTTSGAKLDTLPEIVRSPLITQLRTQQADLLRRESDLASLYGPAFPAITQIRAQKEGMERAISAEVRRLVATLRNDHEVASARESALRKTITTLSDVAGGDNETGVRLRELERTNQANQALFQNFLSRAKITQEQSTFEEPDARVISPALEPTGPSFPKTRLIVPVAAVAGLILGLAVAAAADMFGRRRPRGDAPQPRPARGAGLSTYILGRVPRPERSLATADDVVAVLAAEPDAGFARSIGALAAKLIVSDAARGGRVLMFAALDGGDDARDLVLALACVLGAQGRRVLLIDGDGTRRSLSDACGAGHAVGLGEVLSGAVVPAAAVLPRSRFALLPAGAAWTGGAWAAADGVRLGTLLEEARGRFDLVLVAARSTDDGAVVASALRGAVDGLALVANWDGLMRDAFVAAVDAAADTSDFLGVVLTATEPAGDIALAG